jgi:hypothetical protein
MRKLGDAYVKNEFRLHKGVDSSTLDTFISSWTEYLKMIKRQKQVNGKDIPENELKGLNEEQQKKLHELKLEVEADIRNPKTDSDK